MHRLDSSRNPEKETHAPWNWRMGHDSSRVTSSTPIADIQKDTGSRSKAESTFTFLARAAETKDAKNSQVKTHREWVGRL